MCSISFTSLLFEKLAPFSEHSALCATAVTEHPCLFSDHPHACLPTPLLGVYCDTADKFKVFTTIHFQVFTTVDDRLNPDSKRFCEPYACHCLRMLTYAGRMLTYAGRMLTYTDVRGLWKTDFKPDSKCFCESYNYTTCRFR